jgi:hypothetical protein
MKQTELRLVLAQERKEASQSETYHSAPSVHLYSIPTGPSSAPHFSPPVMDNNVRGHHLFVSFQEPEKKKDNGLEDNNFFTFETNTTYNELETRHEEKDYFGINETKSLSSEGSTGIEEDDEIGDLYYWTTINKTMWYIILKRLEEREEIEREWEKREEIDREEKEIERGERDRERRKR